jgi:flagellar motor switch protein FliG
MMLRNLAKELREGLLVSLKDKDADIAEKVVNLMVVWEDIVEVSDRSLQQALREIDSQKLALALVKADEAIAGKIKSNISERAVAAIEEEMSLMSVPKQEDIDQGREEIVKVLREMNEKDELRFAEE